MKAIVLEHTCNARDLKVTDIAMPILTDENVIVKINAFGINRSEVILRQYEADEDYINLPIVPGIECVGSIYQSNNDEFKVGDKVVALMGGMGRSFNGSYEEYVSLPTKNVFKIKENIIEKFTLEEIASIPETYFTAYASLFECLQIKYEDKLLIRGGTSATGLTAIQLAKALGCKVIATTRNKSKKDKLLSTGADFVVIDDENIQDRLKSIYPNGVDKILELIGPATLSESMKLLSNNGICCMTGILGDKEYFELFDPIKEIPNGKYLTSFFSNYPRQDIIDEIFEYLLKYDIKPCISKIYTSLEHISSAHELMESNNAGGKIIIKLEEF